MTSHLTLTSLIKEAKELPMISPAAVQIYLDGRALLLDHVNRAFDENPINAGSLTTNKNRLIHDNHHYHSLFMSTVMQLGVYDIMVNGIVWAYRAYRARGLPYDYFLWELESWQAAITELLAPETAGEINNLYRWIMARHEHFVAAAEDGPAPVMVTPPRFMKTKSLFLQHLLKGDSRACLRLAREAVASKADTKEFYLYVIQPSLYEIGAGWETGRVSVAQEHLATAIVARVMSVLYQDYVINIEPTEKKALVCTAPGEHHETGPRMIADFLEMDGWDTIYLGADTPLEELPLILEEEKPFLMLMSVTMSFNLPAAKEAIDLLRSSHGARGGKIMVGGLAFKMSDNLWQRMGADGIADTAEDAVRLANAWFEKGGDR